ncbi:MAG: hypothetical protein GHCLOJNM_02234 [bacterium]|nr:hypothetical protein [bacterium]
MHGFLGTTVDLTVIVVYFIGILAFGSYFARYTKSTTDFFFAGRRFAWWLVAVSGVATTVGSYSFIKYSEAAFKYGLAATQTYTNDWMWMPLLALGWIPIIYYNQIRSIPEYFDRRYGTTVRSLYTALLMLYLLGYVGINLYTLGVAVNALMPSVEILPAAIAVAVFTGIYVTAGGQASVIMTDLVQAILMLIGGIIIFFAGIYHLGGIGEFWGALPPDSRHSLGEFAGKSSISFIKIFWQDGIANSFAFWFVNQGMVLRFLAAKSAREAQKAVLFNSLFLMPVAAFAVCNAGLVGRAMVAVGILPENSDASRIFVTVSHMATFPGLFGLIMAALIAALMSTADTLVNGISSIAINDIWRPYLLPGRTDRFYLNLARVHCVGIMAFGLALVPVFAGFATIYDAHGAFTAAITPPLVVALFLAIVWRGFNRAGALAVLLLGTFLVTISLFHPEVIRPFAHGVISEIKPGDPAYKMFPYMRACYGILVCLTVGIVGSWIGGWRFNEPAYPATGSLSVGSLLDLMRSFKNGEPDPDGGKEAITQFEILPGDASDEVIVPESLASQIHARPGDLLYLCDCRAWLGGLKSAHARVGEIRGESGPLLVPEGLVVDGGLVRERPIRVEKLM